MKKEKKESPRLANIWAGIGIGFLSLGVLGATVAGVAKAVIASQKAKIYTVEFDMSGTSTKGVRKDAAKGLVAGINGEKNSFDKAYPWKNISEVTDSHGDVFVRIPKFYEKIDVSEEGKLAISVSSKEHKGFHVAPAFLKGDEEIDYIDIGKYEASLDKSGSLHSKSGEMPEVTGHTLDQYRTIAAKDGNQLFDWRSNQALQSLFAVEFAELDSQKIMAGETYYASYVHELTAEEIEAKKIKTLSVVSDDVTISSSVSISKFIKVNNENNHVEINMQHTPVENVETQEDADKISVNIQQTHVASYKMSEGDEPDLEEVTLSSELDVSKMTEGEQIYINFGAFSYHKTGATDGLKGSSRGASLKSGEITAMSYRGVENWYGNTYTWCDGLATYKEGNNEYICVSMDATKNSDRDSYKKIANGDVISSEEGIFMTKFNMVDNEDSETSEHYDYFNLSFVSGEYRIGGVGGGYGGDAGAGAFFVSVGDTVSYARYSVRLSCLPR